jgi:F5/8 type C domain.
MALNKSVADQATATASSYYSSNFTPSKVFDGIVKQADVGEWASLAELNPWIQLTWSSSKTINSIVLYDRPDLVESANGGTLTFSDGSYINVISIPNDGTAKEITFGEFR